MASGRAEQTHDQVSWQSNPAEAGLRITWPRRFSPGVELC
jgi:hypothetical protein